MAEDKCLFCELAQGNIPTLKVYENEEVVAVLSIKPATKGHMIVMPKKHYAFIQTVPEKVLFQMMIAVKSLVNIVTQVIQAKGVNVMYNLGGLAGQKVGHVSFNIIPRYKDDDVKIKIPEEKGDEEDLRKTQKLIVSAFRKSTIKLLKDIKAGKVEVSDKIREQAEKALDMMEKEAPPENPFEEEKEEKVDVLKLEDKLKKI